MNTIALRDLFIKWALNNISNKFTVGVDEYLHPRGELTHNAEEALKLISTSRTQEARDYAAIRAYHELAALDNTLLAPDKLELENITKFAAKEHYIHTEVNGTELDHIAWWLLHNLPIPSNRTPNSVLDDLCTIFGVSASGFNTFAKRVYIKILESDSDSSGNVYLNSINDNYSFSGLEHHKDDNIIDRVEVVFSAMGKLGTRLDTLPVSIFQSLKGPILADPPTHILTKELLLKRHLVSVFLSGLSKDYVDDPKEINSVEFLLKSEIYAILDEAYTSELKTPDILIATADKLISLANLDKEKESSIYVIIKFWISDIHPEKYTLKMFQVIAEDIVSESSPGRLLSKDEYRTSLAFAFGAGSTSNLAEIVMFAYDSITDSDYDGTKNVYAKACESRLKQRSIYSLSDPIISHYLYLNGIITGLAVTEESFEEDHPEFIRSDDRVVVEWELGDVSCGSISSKIITLTQEAEHFTHRTTVVFHTEYMDIDFDDINLKVIKELVGTLNDAIIKVNGKFLDGEMKPLTNVDGKDITVQVPDVVELTKLFKVLSSKLIES